MMDRRADACRRLVIAGCVIAAMALTGCGGSASGKGDPTSAPRTTDSPAQRVDAINLIAPPTAMNLDDKPGADGVPLTVYLFSVDESAPLSMRSGVLEFLLFGGRMGGEQLRAATPLRTWTFTAADLQRAQDETLIGRCYKIVLRWGDQAPPTRSITLVARYVPAVGRAMYSSPISIGTVPQ